MSSDSNPVMRVDALPWVADRAGAYVAARSFSFLKRSSGENVRDGRTR
jgi:hypothetical protein